MAITNVSEVLKCLGTGNFEALRGLKESEWFECKSEPYFFNDPKTEELKKQALAKAVVAFANTGGGIILLGVETKRNETHYGDEVIDFVCEYPSA